MKQSLVKDWLLVLLAMGAVGVFLCTMSISWAIGGNPPEDRKVFVALEHQLLVRVPGTEWNAELGYEPARIEWVIIERRPYDPTDLDFFLEVLRTQIPEDQTLPCDLLLDLRVLEPGAYQYRAYSISVAGNESEQRLECEYVVCVPGPPASPEIIEVTRLNAADVNCDGRVTATDVQLVINAALRV